MKIRLGHTLKFIVLLSAAVFVFYIRGTKQPAGYTGNDSPSGDNVFSMPYRYHNYDYFFDLDYAFNSSIIRDSMASSKRGIIFAAVLKSADSSECAHFAEGLRQEAKLRNVGMSISYSNNDPRQERLWVSEHLRNNVDAIIMLPVRKVDTEPIVRQVKQENTPIITMWDSVDEMSLDMVDCFVWGLSIGRGKYPLIGLSYSLEDLQTPGQGLMEELSDMLERAGLKPVNF